MFDKLTVHRLWSTTYSY